MLDQGVEAEQKRLRVLMSAFAFEPDRGSEQEVGWKWAREMSKYAQITVLTQTRNRPGIERWLEREGLADPGFEIEYVQLPNVLYRLKSRFDILTTPYYSAWQFWALKRAKALHGAEPFDLVHHVTFAMFRVPIYLKALGVPVVFGPVGGAETASWRLLSHWVPPLQWLREAIRNVSTSMGVWLIRFLPPLRGNRGICLAATPRMEEIFRSLGQPTRLMPTIGIDEEEISLQNGPDRLAKAFLYVGRLHVLKGVHLAIEAFAEAGIEGSRLTIVGDGGEEKRLRALAENLGVTKDIDWVGRVPREELSDYYNRHDVLLAPSFYESGGFAVLEAMQHGRPAIVLAVGGHDVSVTESSGAKIDPKVSASEVVSSMAQAMTAYATTEGLARAHGEAARERAIMLYGWEGKTARMAEVYRSFAEAGVGMPARRGGASVSNNLEKNNP